MLYLRSSLQIMKILDTVKPTPPSTPTPQALILRTLISKTKPKSITTKNLRQPIFNESISRQPICPISSISPNTLKWVPLNLPKSELSLPFTFPTGQTFRWKQTAPLQFTGVIGSHLFSLKHLENGDVAYCLHTSPFNSNAVPALLDFLNVGISLCDMWEEFSVSDSMFAELAQYLAGARVLRQDPVECLIQFLCSSNNNIGRITKMVDFVSSLGKYLGNVGGFDFYEFPSLERLSLVSENEFREAGFGYRAKYIVGTVKSLQSKPGKGSDWLISLRKSDLQEVIGALCTLSGVGPKVASCVALFSLDQHHAIPVDTHVWQIATKHLIPELAGTTLTAKLHGRVADAFVSKYGKYAGWAQTVLFIAQLPSQKLLLPSNFLSLNNNKFAEK